MRKLGSVRTAILLFGVLLLLTGIVYPLLMTAIAGLVFPYQAHGSLVKDERGVTVGSELIGLNFTGPFYFQGRPSATPGSPYNAALSGGSNNGPSNPALLGEANLAIRQLESLGVKGPWPGDLVTSSASGLDPHISPDAALLQVPVVAKARGVAEDQIQALVYRNVVSNPFSPGQGYVNVLSLNQALDRGEFP